MISPTAPAITIRSGGWRRTFAANYDVVVGRDIHAEVRILHPAVSRSHVILRYLDGYWNGFDDNSFNGIFVEDERVRSVQVDDHRTLRLGSSEGPLVTLELANTPPADDSRTQSQDSITIGRRADSDIVVPDVLASLHHSAKTTS